MRRSIYPCRKAVALPPPPLANPSATGAMQGDTQVASLPPNATPKEQYDLAYGYVMQKNYELAAQAFRDFLHKYPSDRLTPEAQYWLGESLFDDQKYHDAAEAFLAVSTKYGTSAKAPDALLRLGQSLAALGREGSGLRIAWRGFAQISARFDQRKAKR